MGAASQLGVGVCSAPVLASLIVRSGDGLSIGSSTAGRRQQPVPDQPVGLGLRAVLLSQRTALSHVWRAWDICVAITSMCSIEAGKAALSVDCGCEQSACSQHTIVDEQSDAMEKGLPCCDAIAVVDGELPSTQVLRKVILGSPVARR